MHKRNILNLFKNKPKFKVNDFVIIKDSPYICKIVKLGKNTVEVQETFKDFPIVKLKDCELYDKKIPNIKLRDYVREKHNFPMIGFVYAYLPGEEIEIYWNVGLYSTKTLNDIIIL